MINSHSDTLEGLRGALAQLHDLRDWYARQDGYEEESFACSVALDWTATAIHYGESIALTSAIEAAQPIPRCVGCLRDYDTGAFLPSAACALHGDWLPMGSHAQPIAPTSAIAEAQALGDCTRCGSGLGINGLCAECRSDDNLQTAKAMGFRPSMHTDCGLLCKVHGDPRLTNISPKYRDSGIQ